MAISLTSKRASRTMGAKARLIVGMSASSSVSKLDRTLPACSACVCGYRPIAARSTSRSACVFWACGPVTDEPARSCQRLHDMREDVLVALAVGDLLFGVARRLRPALQG